MKIIIIISVILILKFESWYDIIFILFLKNFIDSKEY